VILMAGAEVRPGLFALHSPNISAPGASLSLLFARLFLVTRCSSETAFSVSADPKF